MKIIKKKIKSKFYNEIVLGKKNFELILNDLDLNENDVVVIQECDDNYKLTGRELEKKISFIQKININNLPWPPDDVANEGLQIINFE